MTKLDKMRSSVGFGLALLTMALTSACTESPEMQHTAAAPMTVDFMVAEPERFNEELVIPGTLLPFEYVEVYPEVNGRILSIHFTEGQFVKKGQLLFQLDTDIQQAQLKQVLSDLAFAGKEESRRRALWEAKSISLDEYEQSQSRKANLEAQTEVLRAQVEKGRITAPFAGKIGLRQVSEGAFVNTSTQLTTLAQTDKLKIEFALAERFAGNVKTGEKIKFRFPSDSARHQATIYATSSTVDPQSRMLTVRALVQGNTAWIPGTYAEIFYSPGDDQPRILVPATALVPVLKGQKIWLIRNGVATSVAVEPGMRTPTHVEVSGGIAQGDTIILSGLLGLRDGMNVQVKSSNP
jgi:membrane fusion protein, multidrug efflux system